MKQKNIIYYILIFVILNSCNVIDQYLGVNNKFLSSSENTQGINGIQKPKVTLSGDQSSIMIYTSMHIAAYGSGDDVIYHWSVDGGGSIDATGDNVVYKASVTSGNIIITCYAEKPEVGTTDKTIINVSCIDPSNIADLALWLDASAITGLNNDDPVAKWMSRYGGKDVTQDTLQYQPIYKTNVINGLSAIYFDGINDFYSDTIDINSKYMTIFTVFAHDHTISSGPQGPLWQTDQDALFGKSGFFPFKNDGEQYIYTGNNIYKNMPSKFFQNIWSLATVIYREDESILWKNIDWIDTNHDNSITISKFQIAKGFCDDGSNYNYFKGGISELLFYKRPLNDAERVKIQNYLISKWNLNN